MCPELDLTLSLRRAGGGIVGGVEYATSLFERRRSSDISDISAACWKPWWPTTRRPSTVCPMLERAGAAAVALRVERHRGLSSRRASACIELFEEQVRKNARRGRGGV